MSGRTAFLLIAGALVLATGILYAAGVPDKSSDKKDVNAVTEEEAAPEEIRPNWAEVVTKAMAAAYPNRVEKAELHGDDWAVLMDGVWYMYADGRMMPEALRNKADEYSAINLYSNYQIGPLSGEVSRSGNRGSSSNSSYNNYSGSRPRYSQSQRSYFFHEALWNTRSQDEAAKQVKAISFLGRYPTVHSGLADVFAKVEQRIMAAAETDPSVKTWVNGIGEMHGWSWRKVPSNQNRSYHSYGVALDILPKSLGGKETYWLWAAERGKSWWEIPYEDRYHPPDAVIAAFEAYGFVWGGKWTAYFDTMHFEYRPEVFIIAGVELE